MAFLLIVLGVRLVILAVENMERRGNGSAGRHFENEDGSSSRFFVAHPSEFPLR